MADETHTVKVTVKAKTKLAVLVEDPDGEEHWIPFSQIHDDSEIYDISEKGDVGKLVVPMWLAKRCEWEE